MEAGKYRVKVLAGPESGEGLPSTNRSWCLEHDFLQWDQYCVLLWWKGQTSLLPFSKSTNLIHEIGALVVSSPSPHFLLPSPWGSNSNTQRLEETNFLKRAKISVCTLRVAGKRTCYVMLQRQSSWWVCCFSW